jgi:hypothetical protein
VSTQVRGNVQLNAACRDLAGQALKVSLHHDLALGDLATDLDAGRLDLPAIQSLVADQALSGVLATLAPVSFGLVTTALGDLGELARQPTALSSVRADLADAALTASAAIDLVTRDLTVTAFAEAATELGYTVQPERGAEVTGLELRRENELLLLRVHDGGLVESDHAGLADARCGDRQRELEEAVARRGVLLANRRQHEHGSYQGGELIAAAAARGEENLARATVADHQQRAAAGGYATTSARARRQHRARAGGGA